MSEEFVHWQKKLSDDFDVDGYSMPNAAAQDVYGKFLKAKNDALEEAAIAAESWEPVIKLLPLCNEDDNECAMTGQWEARERIVDVIRALKAETP